MTLMSARVVAPLLVAALLGVTTGCSADATGSAPQESTTPPAPTSSAPADQPPTVEEQVAAALADLDERGQVAQLFVVGVQLDDLSPGAELAGSGVGGLFLAGRSQSPAADLAEVTGGWQEQA